MESKSWYASKTLWFNVVSLIIAVAAIFGYGGFQPDSDWREIIAIVVSVVNLALRFVTKKPISK